MLKVLRFLFAGARPLNCRIYPPGIDIKPDDLKGSYLVVVIELP